MNIPLDAYLDAEREYMKLPRLSPSWFEVEREHGRFNDIVLTISDGIYDSKSVAPPTLEYHLSRAEAAELIIMLQDALTASLEAAKKKEQPHVPR